MKKIKNLLSVLLSSILLLSSISSCNATTNSSTPEDTSLMNSSDTNEQTKEVDNTSTTDINSRTDYPDPIDDKYRTYYEVFVYSFADSNNDGIGDLNGLIQKLDYINDGNKNNTSDLGMNGIWLMPIMPSPTYHKYDVLDYMEIDPEYGTLEDFDNFIEEAHSRGIDVIIDLVLNHSAVDHPWFKEAVEALKKGDTENKYVSYYNFAKEKKSDTWYATGADGWYYEAMFWSGMPDYNLASEELRKEFEEIMKFWLVDHKVDGFRLDAVKEFYSGNDPMNIETLEWVNKTAKSIKEDAYLVGEAWSGFTSYKKYYESGIDSFFDFEFADQSGIAVKNINLGNGYDYAKNMANAQRIIEEINPDAINASFLSNHDTGRLAGFLAGDENKLRIAAAANLFTSGSAFVYYGEEIGMRGAGRDENKRAPMLWLPEGQEDPFLTDGPKEMEANGFSYPFGSVEEQMENSSLLSHYRSLVEIRNRYPEIARGKTTLVEEIEEKAFMPILKTWEKEDGTVETCLIMANFSMDEHSLTIPEKYKDLELVATFTNVENEDVQAQGVNFLFPPYTIAVFK